MTEALGNRELMAHNIKRLLDAKGMTVKDLANAIGIAPTTVYGWTQGQYYPRIDKIEMMANFFGVSKAELVEGEQIEDIMQEAFDRPDMRTLFSLAKDCTPDQIDATIKLLEQFKNLNKGE